ncbi:restriction endonuclease [Streptomyces phaeochromogenes]|uniref:restriction endonuclease n=1 Tax=Streptomyces phaeochromogenes TaxID=1923 RepID=UPI0036C0ABEE
MARRALRLRKPRGSGEQAAAAVVACAALWLLARMAMAAWHAATRAWPWLAAFIAAAAVMGMWRMLRTARARRVRAQTLARLRLTLAEIDAMDDVAFEFALRDLLIRDGWTAHRVGQQGDQAADVIGQDRQRGRIVLQAKHTKVAGKVGSSVMYQVKGTAGPVHGANIAVVVTNGSFTRDAKAWGERHDVYWVDRDRLRRWAEHGTPLQNLLRLPNRPARRAAFRRAA